MKKLRIGFFTDTYKPQINGVVSSVESFRQELKKAGHHVYIFCPKVKSEKSTKEIIRFKAFKFVFQPEYQVSIPFSRKIIQDFWDKELDIVHAHTPFSLGQLAYAYSQIKKRPFIYTYHTLYPEYVKSYIWQGKILTPQMVEKLVAAYSNRCDLNIAPSEKIKILLKKYGVKTPVDILPTGINLSDFNKIAHNNFRQRYKIKPNEKLLLYVGRLGKEKNLDFLIKTFALIIKEFKESRFVLVGDGPDKQALIKLVNKLDLKGKVIFTGYLEKKQVVKAYQQSDIFLFASKTDTQGMVILEAAACNLPIVAVKDKAFSNILQDKVNGFTVQENQKIFSQAVLNLLKNDKLYKKMSVNSRQIAQEFSSKKQTQKLLQIYNKFL